MIEELSNKKIRKEIRKCAPTLNLNSAKIILVCGYTPPEEMLTQTKIANALNKAISTINDNITKLKEGDYLTKDLRLNPKGKKAFTELKRWDTNMSQKLRGHNVQIGFKIARPPKDFEEIRNKCIGITNGRYKGFKIELLGCQVMFYSPKKCVAVIRDVYGLSDEEIYVRVMEIGSDLKNALEQMYGGLKIDNYEPFTIQSQHIAWMNHPLAQLFKKLDRGYKSDRIEIDNSHNIPELETIHPITAGEDMDKIIEYEKTIRGLKDDTEK